MLTLALLVGALNDYLKGRCYELIEEQNVFFDRGIALRIYGRIRR